MGPSRPARLPCWPSPRRPDSWRRAEPRRAASARSPRPAARPDDPPPRPARFYRRARPPGPAAARNRSSAPDRIDPGLKLPPGPRPTGCSTTPRPSTEPTWPCPAWWWCRADGRRPAGSPSSAGPTGPPGWPISAPRHSTDWPPSPTWSPCSTDRMIVVATDYQGLGRPGRLPVPGGPERGPERAGRRPGGPGPGRCGGLQRGGGHRVLPGGPGRPVRRADRPVLRPRAVRGRRGGGGTGGVDLRAGPGRSLRAHRPRRRLRRHGPVRLVQDVRQPGRDLGAQPGRPWPTRR